MNVNPVRQLVLVALVVMLCGAIPSTVGAESAASPPPAEIAAADEGPNYVAYVIALTLIGGASVLSTFVAAAVVRRIERIAPPDENDRR